MALVTCPDCKKQLSLTAATCPNCGRRNDAKTQQDLKSCFGCFGLIVVLALIISVYTSLAGGGSAPATVAEPGNIEAFILCKAFVEPRLKSPKSADFPVTDYTASKQGSTFTISSYVDAQNGFGANIRSRFICKITHKGGDWTVPNNWTLDDLTFSE